MLDAICMFDEDEPVTYSVFKFQKLSDADIERYRQSLICPQCHGKAYYRKASLDGKAACFGSRYHQANCKEFKPSQAKAREEQDAIEVNQLVVDSDALIIDFTKRPSIHAPKAGAKPVSKEKSLQAESGPNVGEEREVVDSYKVDVESAKDDISKTSLPDDKRVSTQGLEKLLHSLLRGSELAESELWVYTDDKYRWRAKNLFVNFADAEPTENGAPRMYWGTVSHIDKSMQWLNPSDSRDVGIPIEEFQGSLFERFNIKDRRDIEGAGIILFGKCFLNKDKTRKIIQLWGKDISRVFISKLDD
ncbi:conserved hypothetical protein [Shewanella sediminis HAW-EB3]|uniref:Uncharacterized protein n=1 Tax=Shewanella sediminis (strain HAW-EB3) TaxID=425104 RepID=A8FZW1_SHESH|nr:hypothetical protein [Shewanella sediminis]ABV38384.1 conserved hypothetical protein [Shewanella sediminis HAW-EB3]